MLYLRKSFVKTIFFIGISLFVFAIQEVHYGTGGLKLNKLSQYARKQRYDILYKKFYLEGEYYDLGGFKAKESKEPFDEILEISSCKIKGSCNVKNHYGVKSPYDVNDYYNIKNYLCENFYYSFKSPFIITTSFYCPNAYDLSNSSFSNDKIMKGISFSQHETIFSCKRDYSHCLSCLKAEVAHVVADTETMDDFNKMLESSFPDVILEDIELENRSSVINKHLFKGAFMIGHLWDSNATLGTACYTNVIGTGMMLPPTRRCDRTINIGLIYNHEYPIRERRWFWKNGIMGYTSMYHKIPKLDFRLVELSTGIQYINKRHQADFFGTWMSAQLKEHLYQCSPGLSIQYKFMYSNKLILKTAFVCNRIHHFNVTTRKIISSENFGLFNSYCCGFTWILNKMNIFDVNCWHIFDQSPNLIGFVPRFYICHRNDFKVNYIRMLSSKINLNLVGEYRADRYNFLARRGIRGIKRADHSFIGACGFMLKASPKLLFEGLYKHTGNTSNNPWANYKTNQVAFALTYLL